MDWIRENLALAKNGNVGARVKLAIPVLLFALVVYLQFGSTSTKETIRSKPVVSNEPVLTALFVHIVGAVKNPGVYALDSGSRVYDLVAAAGGFSKGADQGSVNLARLLNDGEQIQVYRTGVETVASKLLNLNRATAVELEQLPGVGPKLAARIVDWRSTNGGFSSIDQLRKVGGIGDKLFAGLRELVSI